MAPKAKPKVRVKAKAKAKPKARTKARTKAAAKAAKGAAAKTVKVPTPRIVFDGPKAGPVLALAHGAGAPMDSPFMEAFAKGLGNRGVRVARFEFPYMAQRRKDGQKRPPDRMPVLMATWDAVIAAIGPTAAIGGKSMGGRIASMIAAEREKTGASVPALVCLGYPFHAAGRTDARTEHLEKLRTRTLICQGTRDSMGTKDEVKGYALSRAIAFAWLEDGDHSLKPRKASGLTETENWNRAMDAIVRFLGVR